MLAGVSHEGKNMFYCMNWELKHNLGDWGHCHPLSGVSEGPEGKAFGKSIIFSLKLNWYDIAFYK